MGRRSIVALLVAGIAFAVATEAQAAGLQLGALSPIGCVAKPKTTTCPQTGTGVGRMFSAVVSPDGHSVYGGMDPSVATASLVAFQRASAGALTSQECFEAAMSICGSGHQLPNIDFVTDVAVSPDGRSVYATSQSGMVELFDRAADGSLTSRGCFTQTGGAGGCAHSIPGLGDPEGIVVSPDGANVYVASYDSRAVTMFARAADGSLTSLGCIEDPGGDNAMTPVHECGSATAPAMKGATGIAISPDGKSVYVAAATSNAIVRFDRGAGGMLTPVACIQELAGADCGVTTRGLTTVVSIVVSPDGRNVYTHTADASGSLGIFNRAADGSVTGVTCIGGGGASECPTSVSANSGNIFTPHTVAIAPDGRSVYVASNGRSAVLTFDRAADGGLTFRGCFENTGGVDCGAGTTPGLSGASGVAVSPAGDSVYVASDDGIAIFSRGLAPVCSPASGAAPFGQPAPVTLSCSDPNGDPVTLSIASGPQHGSLSAIDQAHGSVTYTPAAGFSGSDTFMFAASDGTNTASAQASVTIGTPPVAPAAKLSALTLSPRAFASYVGPGASTARAHRHPKLHRGSRVSFRLNVASRLRFTVSRVVSGRRMGRRCVARTHANRRRKSCTRLIPVRGGFQVAATAGLTRFTFTGRVGGRRLAAGSYVLVAAAGRAKPVNAAFRILRG